MTITLDRELHCSPCVPAEWKSFEVHYRYRETVYHITVLQTVGADGGTKLTIDGVEQSMVSSSPARLSFWLMTASNTRSR